MKDWVTVTLGGYAAGCTVDTWDDTPARLVSSRRQGKGLVCTYEMPQASYEFLLKDLLDRWQMRGDLDPEMYQEAAACKRTYERLTGKKLGRWG